MLWSFSLLQYLFTTVVRVLIWVLCKRILIHSLLKCNACLSFKRDPLIVLSVSPKHIAGIMHCNQRWPLEKCSKWPIWPFLFIRLQALHRHSILEAFPELQIVIYMVINIRNILSLKTKIRQTFWFSHRNDNYISLCWQSTTVILSHITSS